jgi:hypothetical protein
MNQNTGTGDEGVSMFIQDRGSHYCPSWPNLKIAIHVKSQQQEQKLGASSRPN